MVVESDNSGNSEGFKLDERVPNDDGRSDNDDVLGGGRGSNADDIEDDDSEEEEDSDSDADLEALTPRDTAHKARMAHLRAENVFLQQIVAEQDVVLLEMAQRTREIQEATAQRQAELDALILIDMTS